MHVKQAELLEVSRRLMYRARERFEQAPPAERRKRELELLRVSRRVDELVVRVQAGEVIE